MKSGDIITALRKQYCQPEWSLFTEVANATGASVTRRADAIAMNMWPSRGLELRAFEVKVSKSDLKSELKDPSKAEAFSKFCNTFYLVVPKGLTDGFDIPATWGIIEVDGRGCRVKQQSFFNKEPEPMTRGFVASLLRSSTKAVDLELDAAVRLRTKQLRDSLDGDVKRKVEQHIRNMACTDKDSNKLFEKLTEELGKSTSNLLYDSDFIKAVSIVHSLKLTSDWIGFGGIHKDLLKVATTASALAEHMGEAIKDISYVETSKKQSTDTNSAEE